MKYAATVLARKTVFLKPGLCSHTSHHTISSCYHPRTLVSTYKSKGCYKPEDLHQHLPSVTTFSFSTLKQFPMTMGYLIHSPWPASPCLPPWPHISTKGKIYHKSSWWWKYLLKFNYHPILLLPPVTKSWIQLCSKHMTVREIKAAILQVSVCAWSIFNKRNSIHTPKVNKIYHYMQHVDQYILTVGDAKLTHKLNTISGRERNINHCYKNIKMLWESLTDL